MICGSYIRGGYNNKSDLDILFIIDNQSFEMKLEYFNNILFDRLIVDYNNLKNILLSEAKISNYLSHSIGSDHKIIIDSPEIQDIIDICKKNISIRNIFYNRSENKKEKKVDGKKYIIKKIDKEYYLYKGNTKIV